MDTLATAASTIPSTATPLVGAGQGLTIPSMVEALALDLEVVLLDMPAHPHGELDKRTVYQTPWLPT